MTKINKLHWWYPGFSNKWNADIIDSQSSLQTSRIISNGAYSAGYTRNSNTHNVDTKRPENQQNRKNRKVGIVTVVLKMYLSFFHKKQKVSMQAP